MTQGGSADRVAAFQRHVQALYRMGDPVAKDIYTRAAEQLSLLVRALKDRLNFDENVPVSVSWSGGLFKAGECIYNEADNVWEISIVNSVETGALEIDKTVVIDNKLVTDASKLNGKKFYVEIFRTIGNDTYYVTKANGILKKAGDGVPGAMLLNDFLNTLAQL